MALLKIGAFATFAGVSRTALYRAINTGRITRRSDGLIDTATRLNAEYVTGHNDGVPKQPGTKPQKTKPPAGKARKPQKGKRRKRKPPAVIPYESPFAESDEPVNGTPETVKVGTARADAELRKLVAQTRKYEIQAD